MIERAMTVLGIVLVAAAAALYGLPRLFPPEAQVVPESGIDLERIISERGFGPPGSIPIRTSEEHREVMRVLASATEENAAECVETLRRLLAGNEGSALRRAGLAWGLFLAGKPVEARVELDRAFEIDPECPLALAAAACEHLRHRRFGKAEDCFRRALVVSPTVAEWRRMHARTLLAAGRDEEALVEAERSVALAPRSPTCYLAVGDVHLRAGRLDDALRWYEAACRLAGPDSTMVLEHEPVLAAMRGP